tara:strand:- start:45515 stop:46015 length:501 start_codon:yes stop_codon:yes gene_type:complete
MNLTEKLNYRHSVKEFVNLTKFYEPFSVTLTLKQSVLVTEGVFPVHIRIDREKAIQNFRHFMNLLNTEVFGNSFVRHGKRIQVIPFLEGGLNGTRLHYHCVIDCPRRSLDMTFPSLIQKCWSKTSYGYNQIDIQRNTDHGWIDYISKFRGKYSYDECVDWENFHQD